MKKIIIFSLCLLFFPFVGCQKDTVVPEITITENDVADVLGSAIASSSKGLVWQMGIGSELADSGEFPAMRMISASPIETTVTKQGSFGGYSFLYTARYRYEFSLLQDSLSFQYWLKGTYSTPRASADDSVWANFRITEFLGRDSCMINGTYNRLGIHTLKIREQKQFTSRVTATLTNIVFDKRTKKAMYGTIALNVSGESSTGNAFSYSGVLAIYGNELASLIINDVTYEVNLNTGNATWVEDDDGGL